MNEKKNINRSFFVFENHTLQIHGVDQNEHNFLASHILHVLTCETRRSFLRIFLALFCKNEIYGMLKEKIGVNRKILSKSTQILTSE